MYCQGTSTNHTLVMHGAHASNSSHHCGPDNRGLGHEQASLSGFGRVQSPERLAWQLQAAHLR